MIKNVFIFIVLAACIGAAIWFFVAKSKSTKEVNLSPSVSPSPSAASSPTVSPSSDVGKIDPSKIPMDKISGQDITVGTGAEAKSGDSVKVNYTGTLVDGTVFDSSVDPKFKHVEPFIFNLGTGQVIKGWDIGVAGMKVGGKRLLIIPPSFGYGDQDQGPIPANSILIFEVELLGVTPPAK